jgi:hypothetical protein
MLTDHLASRKLRKPPPVTPKRFQKFFTPRSSASRTSKQSLSKSGRQLREITQSGLNRRAGQRTRSPRKTVVFEDAIETPPTKRRKLYITPDSSPPRSSPCKNAILSLDLADIGIIPSSPPSFLPDEDMTILERSLSPEPRRPPPRIQRARALGVSGRILQRSFGTDAVVGRRPDNCSRMFKLCYTRWQTIFGIWFNLKCVYIRILAALKFNLLESLKIFTFR